jgi:hypothetical protein
MKESAAESGVPMADIQPVPHNFFADHYHLNEKRHWAAAWGIRKLLAEK